MGTCRTVVPHRLVPGCYIRASDIELYRELHASPATGIVFTVTRGALGLNTIAKRLPQGKDLCLAEKIRWTRGATTQFLGYELATVKQDVRSLVERCMPPGSLHIQII